MELLRYYWSCGSLRHFLPTRWYTYVLHVYVLQNTWISTTLFLFVYLFHLPPTIDLRSSRRMSQSPNRPFNPHHLLPRHPRPSAHILFLLGTAILLLLTVKSVQILQIGPLDAIEPAPHKNHLLACESGCLGFAERRQEVEFLRRRVDGSD